MCFGFFYIFTFSICTGFLYQRLRTGSPGAMAQYRNNFIIIIITVATGFTVDSVSADKNKGKFYRKAAFPSMFGCMQLKYEFSHLEPLAMSSSTSTERTIIRSAQHEMERRKYLSKQELVGRFDETNNDMLWMVRRPMTIIIWIWEVYNLT